MTELSQREIEFIESRDSFYMATVGETGWPYVQFRGGPSGFLKAISSTQLAFADFRGNRQYISTGNLKDTGKAALILMDYPKRMRLKIWADTEIIGRGDEELRGKLILPEYNAKVERFVLFDVKAYDWNCPQHITPRYTEAEMQILMEAGPVEF